MHITLLPAYGRDYKSKKAALADFDANKDFMWRQPLAVPDQLINKEQIPVGATVWIRYKNLTQVFSTVVKEEVKSDAT